MKIFRCAEFKSECYSFRDLFGSSLLNQKKSCDAQYKTCISANVKGAIQQKTMWMHNFSVCFDQLRTQTNVTKFHFVGFNHEYLLHSRDFASEFSVDRSVLSRHSVHRSILDHLSSVVNRTKIMAVRKFSKIAMHFQSHRKSEVFLRNHSEHKAEFVSWDF